MKILITGINGQLGSCLCKSLSNFEIIEANKETLDLSGSEHEIKNLLNKINPELIINSAAYTKVDNAEEEKEAAYKINSRSLNAISEFANERNIYLIHYSTDYVFDGKKRGDYFENDKTKPINYYGESKLIGENYIKKNLSKYFIFRTTWVIGKKGKNFAKTILHLAKEKSILKVINDQIGVPTSTNLISSVTNSCISSISKSNPWASGIYNLVPNGKTSWFGVAKLILEMAENYDIYLTCNKENLLPIKSSEFPSKTKRPLNSLLNNSKLNKVLDFELPYWEDDFKKIAEEILDDFKNQI